MNAVLENLPFMLAGLLDTAQLAIAAISLSAVLGIGVGAMRAAQRRTVRYPAIGYIQLIRSAPLIVFILYSYFVLADLGLDLTPYWAGVLALGVFTSAYLAEIVHGGIASVPSGQWEAARASGLSGLSTLRYVILPQALRRMAPALVSELIKLIKDTSLVSVIGVFEFFHRVEVTNARVLTEPFAVLGFAALCYFAINFALSRVAKRLELRLDV
ncbi:amino acid ABC transporter permease [Saccharopolyspora sp. K220]|uniref:amino acid ABC transporter permease n=1 Tax=Saccharopolyspora soli TaxID=2926618 RepID=UPI001F58E155|nr:amino acid ABC transporter permease [Saccharopolyspora soli]MCI2421671.1 amino acid ABC transporter permease [Saccharopolyspora soli]